MTMADQKACIINGKELAKQVKQDVAKRAATLREQGCAVRLDAVLAGDDSGAAMYAENQKRTCEELGIEYVLHRLDPDATYEEVAGRVLLLNEDDDVNAIMVHLPLPEGVDTDRVQSLIDVDKDVEGVNPANIGNVVYGRRSLVPCTALAVMEMIESTGVELCGTRCVVVGASNIVGKPVVVLLMSAKATVISTNIYTRDIEELIRSADVLISATGVAGLIKGNMVKPGAVVIDVGIARIMEGGKSRTVGDVQFDEVAEVAGHLSPVPGGVGPMTVAMLLRNTIQAAERT
ncbi:MAG: bifunctional 5,10-methylenetetrahydrofolate dehydrogenase/5,10-methenyltetrahydrofolate cyclohydrolase [Phycisphaerales bacterium]|nr:MAG: bifunctional 5,10-methylenetetrahydrofolate dehydrogenase/5,10-methenyltetrahydrofolate cyclohydrolase [Phycisphaerales bacterium]